VTIPCPWCGARFPDEPHDWVKHPSLPSRAYTSRGYTTRARGYTRHVPAPRTNLEVARRFARQWLSRIGREHVDDFGRGVVPMRVHSGAYRLVRWAESRAQ
jgi:hypothetical protein